MSILNDPEIEEYRKEYSELSRSGFEGYRKAGLGLSATIIFLAMVLLRVLLENPAPGAAPSVVILCKGLLLVSILSALTIQGFNYFGAKELAHTYQKLLDHFRLRQVELTQESKDEAKVAWLKGKKYSDNAAWHFTRADLAVKAALVLLFLGFILWLFATRYLF